MIVVAGVAGKGLVGVAGNEAPFRWKCLQYNGRHYANNKAKALAFQDYVTINGWKSNNLSPEAVPLLRLELRSARLSSCQPIEAPLRPLNQIGR